MLMFEAFVLVQVWHKYGEGIVRVEALFRRHEVLHLTDFLVTWALGKRLDESAKRCLHGDLVAI